MVTIKSNRNIVAKAAPINNQVSRVRAKLCGFSSLRNARKICKPHYNKVMLGVYMKMYLEVFILKQIIYEIDYINYYINAQSLFYIINKNYQ